MSDHQEVTYTLDLRQSRRENQPVCDRHPTGGKTADGPIPRIARLMALAIRFEGLLREGTIRDHAELARLGRVTRARMAQIMRLLNLAPDIQEQILFLPLVQGLKREKPATHCGPDRLGRTAAHVSDDYRQFVQNRGSV